MAETWVLLTVFLLFAAAWLALREGSAGLAQAPTPATTQVPPATSTSSPSEVIVSPVSNVAESTTEPLAGTADDGSDVSTGVIAGVGAAAAVLFAGIAFRLARGRTGAG